MKRLDDGLYYAHCIQCDKRAVTDHMERKHDAKGFDHMMGLFLPSSSAPFLDLATFADLKQQSLHNQGLVVGSFKRCGSASSSSLCADTSSSVVKKIRNSKYCCLHSS